MPPFKPQPKKKPKKRPAAAAGFGGGLAQAMLRPRHPTLPPTIPGGQGTLPTPPIPGPQAAAGQAVAPGYDPMVDPAVAAAFGLAERERTTAKAKATAKKIAAAIEYGDAEGLDLDPETAAAAKNNPYSILAGLERSHKEGVGRLEEGLNQSNLHYSGTRGKELADAEHRRGQARSDAATRFRGVIGDSDSGLADALMGADMMEVDALSSSTHGRYGEGEGAATAAPGDPIRASAAGRAGIYFPGPQRSSATGRAKTRVTPPRRPSGIRRGLSYS